MSEPVPNEIEASELAGEIEGGFSRRTLGWIIGCASVSFVAAVLLSVYGRDLVSRPTPEANTFSYSAVGHRAVVEFLRSMGLGVVSRQAPAGGVGPGRPLVVAEPDRSDSARLKALREEARDRHAALVIVLPKWVPGSPERDKPGWLSKVSLMSIPQVELALKAFGDEELREVTVRRAGRLRCTARWEGSTADLHIVEQAQLLEPAAGLEPVVQCPEGYLIARRAGAPEPRTFVIADPDLLNNQGLDRGDNAEGIYQFFTRDLAATGLVFDETIHGFSRVPGLLAESLRFPMVLGVLQSLLLLGVVLWSGMGRFGKPLPAAPALGAGKEALIDNTAKLLVNGGHAGDSLLLYFRQTTRAVAAHYFLPPDLPDAERLVRLQRITHLHGLTWDLAALERSIHRLPDGRRGGEPAAKIARRLYEWRMEMTNGHREGS
ncbi:MAG TPA: hypothetical protein VFR03_21845 [Thermoanaerobaculia bacterium]|nr:hypothetical protein [Thermoanaerobaculia bacterium]